MTEMDAGALFEALALEGAEYQSDPVNGRRRRTERAAGLREEYGDPAGLTKRKREKRSQDGRCTCRAFVKRLDELRFVTRSTS